MFLKKVLPLALVLAACSEKTPTTIPDSGQSTASDAGVAADATATAEDSGILVAPDSGVTPSGLTRSEKARVRFKGQVMLRNDFAAALSLDPATLCREVGTYDCFDVHRIPLRGVEPYTLGAYEPVEDTTVTTPLAVDRIALSACRDRAIADFEDAPNAVIWKGLSLGAGGELSDPNAPAVETALDLLYRRLLSRRALPEEIAKLRGLYAEVTAASEPNPGRAWAILSCFAVATSEESLFY